MIKLNSYRFSENGHRIDYDYTASGIAQKFLNVEETFFVRYDCDVSACPPAIIVIPFIANFITIAWFGKFDLVVSEVDAVFADSLVQLRAEFQRMYPKKDLRGSLRSASVTRLTWEGDKGVMLFSGGVDAFATLIRHRHESLVLTTIWGADIELTDKEQWQRCLKHIATDPLSEKLPRSTIISNLRTFYTDKVESDLVYGWWGMVQHGPALLGLQAPLTYILQASRIYIASSYTVPGGWGSTKESDEKIMWGPVKCIHDGDGLTRKAKVEIIVDCAQERGQPIPLRVCYSEVQRDGNCGRCEKCYRSMLNIILTNADPRLYGFPMTIETYPAVFQLMAHIHSSYGLKIFWGEIAKDARRALISGRFFVLVNRTHEAAFLGRIADGEINHALEKNHKPWRDALARWKFIARVRFPRFYQAGRSLARLFYRRK